MSPAHRAAFSHPPNVSKVKTSPFPNHKYDDLHNCGQLSYGDLFCRAYVDKPTCELNYRDIEYKGIDAYAV